MRRAINLCEPPRRKRRGIFARLPETQQDASSPLQDVFDGQQTVRCDFLSVVGSLYGLSWRNATKRRWPCAMTPAGVRCVASALGSPVIEVNAI